LYKRTTDISDSADLKNPSQIETGNPVYTGPSALDVNRENPAYAQAGGVGGSGGGGGGGGGRILGNALYGDVDGGRGSHGAAMSNDLYGDIGPAINARHSSQPTYEVAHASRVASNATYTDMSASASSLQSGRGGAFPNSNYLGEALYDSAEQQQGHQTRYEMAAASRVASNATYADMDASASSMNSGRGGGAVPNSNYVGEALYDSAEQRGSGYPAVYADYDVATTAAAAAAARDGAMQNGTYHMAEAAAPRTALAHNTTYQTVAPDAAAGAGAGGFNSNAGATPTPAPRAAPRPAPRRAAPPHLDLGGEYLASTGSMLRRGSVELSPVVTQQQRTFFGGSAGSGGSVLAASQSSVHSFQEQPLGLSNNRLRSGSLGHREASDV